MLVMSLLAGVLSWSLLEYVLHRFAGHYRPLLRLRLNNFGREHTRHHAQGDYFAPGWKKALFAAVVLGLLLPPVAWLMGTGHAVSYLSGLLGFYLVYEWLHLRLHTHAPRTAWGHWARRHHFFHHFHDPRRNHGVTSPLWDHVFGTHASATQVQVPRKLAMVWLLDGDVVRASHRTDYAIRQRSRRAG